MEEPAVVGQEFSVHGQTSCSHLVEMVESLGWYHEGESGRERQYGDEDAVNHPSGPLVGSVTHCLDQCSHGECQGCLSFPMLRSSKHGDGPFR